MRTTLFSNRDLARLFLPLVVEQGLEYLVGLTATLFIASIGEAAVSGVSPGADSARTDPLVVIRQASIAVRKRFIAFWGKDFWCGSWLDPKGVDAVPWQGLPAIPSAEEVRRVARSASVQEIEQAAEYRREEQGEGDRPQ